MKSDEVQLQTAEDTKPRYIIIAMLLTLSWVSRSDTGEETLIISKRGSEQSVAGPNLDDRIKTLKKSMIDYMSKAHPAYTERDVNACEGILNAYRSEMSKSNSKKEGIEVVKTRFCN